MRSSSFEGKVLFVDDDYMTRELIRRQAKHEGVNDFEIYEDSNSAVARLEGLDETVAAIFSDGLNGGWREVISAAKEARIPAFVISGDNRIQQEVEETGTTFILKPAKPGFILAALAELNYSVDA